MGMHLQVKGLRSPKDAHYIAMCEVVRACARAGISLPPEVEIYFGRDAKGESAANVLKYQLEAPLLVEIKTSEFEDDHSSGFEVLVEDIPEGVKSIRFYGSY